VAYIFPTEIPIDARGSLEQLTSSLGTVRDGLPEIAKNAKDQYLRLGVEPEHRHILILASTSLRQVAVIDFAGATLKNFEGWEKWSSRRESEDDLADVEAGHGNGGKAFMVRGATRTSYLESCANGVRTRMGFANDDPENLFKPGFAQEGGQQVRNLSEADPAGRLNKILKPFGLTVGKLPEAVQATFLQREAYTAVVLDEVTDWATRRKSTVVKMAHALPQMIGSHGQTALTIEICKVQVFIDGKLITSEPIQPQQLEPFAGFEDPIVLEIPDELEDPETGETVRMDEVAGLRTLRLRTCAKHMQMSEDLKARNVIRISNNKNNVATWTLPSLTVGVPSVGYIYGDIRCPSLIGHHLAGADRMHLAATPLVNALRNWTAQRVQDLALQIQSALMAEPKPKDKQQASSALSGMRDIMRRFLDPSGSGGLTGENNGSGTGGGGENGKSTTRHGAEWGERVDEILLESGKDRIALANGTRVPLSITCIEWDGDKRRYVKNPGLVLRGSGHSFVALEAGPQLSGVAAGSGDLWVETLDGGVQSNQIIVEVVDAVGVDVVVPEEPLLQGQRIKFPLTFKTAQGPRDDLLIEAAVDEPGAGVIGRSGRFTAGAKPGEATVRVRFGAAPTASQAASLIISNDRVPPSGTGDHGVDIPQILFCGDEAPGMADVAPEFRTYAPDEGAPTIIEDPCFPNVVWINPRSREAQRVRKAAGGPAGVSGLSTQQFMHFVALKCFDVLKRLFVRQAIGKQSVNEATYMQQLAIAEVQCAGFIDEAWEFGVQMIQKKGAQLDDAA
jgi:hypothetical protein